MRVAAPFRPAAYRVEFTNTQLLRVGCVHHLLEDGCRPCSVSAELYDAEALNTMTVTTTRNFRTGTMTVYGWVYEPEGRKALVRMMALAHGHPDPNTMEGWDQL